MAEQTEDALAAREAAIAAREAALEAREGQARAADDAAFVDRLVADARLPKSERALALSLLAAADARATVEFAEIGAASPRDALRALLGRLPQAVAFGEHARATDTPDLAGADWQGIATAADALIKQRADQGQTLSFIEAVRLVTEETRA